MLARVVFETKHQAADAFGDLHGRNIYDGCCQLDIRWCSSQDPRNTNLAFSCGDTMVTTAAARPATSVVGQYEFSNTNNSVEVATTVEIVSGVAITPLAPMLAKAAGDNSEDIIDDSTYSFLGHKDEVFTVACCPADASLVSSGTHNVNLQGISVGNATLQLPTSTVDSDDSSEEPYELVEAPVSTPLEDFKLIYACALEAFQLISGCSKSVSNYLTYNGLEGTHIKVIEFVRDNDYLVCGPGSIVQLDTSSTLSDFIKMLEEHPKLQLSKAIVMHEGNNMYMQLRKVLEHMTWTNLSVPMFELLKEVPYTIASDRSCTQLEFDIAGTGITYESSNCIGVYTENCPGVVEEAERWLGYSPDSFEVVDQGVQHFFVMIWDPSGIDVMYRFEGKPIFKKGGMLGTCYYAITCLITERAINR